MGNTVGILKNMEPVTTDPKGEASMSHRGNTLALAKKKRFMEVSSYLTGFVDGEGSFLVSFNRRAKLGMGVEVRPSFSISQHKRNLELLQQIQLFFGCGGIRFDRHDQTYKYEVRSLDDLWNKIIPYFKKHPLLTLKARDFDIFVGICSLMKANKHRSQKGIEAIINSAYLMNNYGARRYERHELLKIVRKMKV